MKRLSISEEVINKVVAVLSGLPYRQVAGLVNEISADVRPIEVKDLKVDSTQQEK